MNEPLRAQSLNRMKTLVNRAVVNTPFIDRGFLPIRLLDLETDTATKIKLIVTSEDRDAKGLPASQRWHAALSYCWGNANEAKLQLQTTNETMKAHLSDIQLDTVPRAISDAVHVCRCLGIRYLWVDALCIIQGDADDWSRESFNMSHIYSSSFLTLYAL